MSYKLHFIKKSKKEWDKLNSTTREQFKKKLEKRLEEPVVLSDKGKRENNDVYNSLSGRLDYEDEE